MTIDETIKYEKMCSERRDAFVDRTTEEHKQLAEWLEELKALKSDSIPIIHGKAELELHDKEIRANAIDEFAKQLKSDEFQKYNLDMVFETSRDLSYSHCINAFHEYVDEIAKQLKIGGAV